MSVRLIIDGRKVDVAEGATLLDATRALGIDTPTLCHAPNLTPVNVCRLCVVELEGARTLVPSCSRKAEPNMVVHTDSERVRAARRGVLELLGSSVDLSAWTARDALFRRYGVDVERYGPPGARHAERDQAEAGHHHRTNGLTAERVAQPVKTDNALFVRDYSRCVLCFKCVEACGDDAQHTFAISVAGRGFEARVSTEFNVPLDESACVFCGNCIGVCPTAALQFTAEHALREAGRWDEQRQTQTTTVCTYCGVGCAVTLHVQDGRIVKTSSPTTSSVTSGHLCVKGRFGFEFVQK